MHEISDFWEENDQKPIHFKETDAVYKVLQALGENLANSRVHVWTDTQCLAESEGKEQGVELYYKMYLYFDYVVEF